MALQSKSKAKLPVLGSCKCRATGKPCRFPENGGRNTDPDLDFAGLCYKCFVGAHGHHE
jgi:hypothetical protein